MGKTGRYEHKVSIGDMRRDRKKATDVSRTSAKQEINAIFNRYYKEQLRALYREVTRGM